MIKSLLKLNELLKNDKIRFKGLKNNNVFHSYSLYPIIKELRYDSNQEIYQNFMESPIIIINHFVEYSCNLNDIYFIISFKKTILIINQIQVNFLHSLFSTNENVIFCFLSDCHNIFIHNYQNQINQIQCNDMFNEEEIYNFKNEIYIDKSSKNLISEHLINIIMTSIGEYLIKQSYSKLNIKCDSYFQTNKKPDETIFDEDDFIELRQIGAGSSFNVRLMYHIEKEELFAMKLSNSDDPELVEREINNYRRMNYPLIPKYYGTIKGKNCLMIEFINGRTLDNINDIDENDIYTIFFQLLIIFNYLHKNEFVYRDLKPNNVIIDERKRVFLIDFDRLIKISDEPSTTDFKSDFVSPDVNEKKISYSNDIYSLCKIFRYLEIQDQEFITLIESNIKKNSISEFITKYYIKFNSNINIDISIIQNDSDVLLQLAEIHKNATYGLKNIEKSIYYYTLAANQNHPDAQFNLGYIYFEGKYIKQDIDKSIHYFTLAANQNNIKSQFILGFIYLECKYIKKDINKSIHYLTLAANNNSPKAQYNLGVFYSEGKYIKQDIDKSIHYYTLAANQNHPDAQFKLGVIYYEGKYIKRDINKSIHYLTLAAYQNDSEAQFNLGFIYGEDKYITRDINKSIYYLTLAANKNHPDAQFNLGLIYKEGKYVARDIEKSIYYYSLAANQNHPKAQNNLAYIYLEGKYVTPDINKSIYYFTLAANQNYPDAQFNLGYIYKEGKHIKRDINKSIHYLTLAANQNIPQAQYYLGVIYYEDKYIKQDIDKSIYYFTLAANQNYPDAQFTIGAIYYEGKYITRDINKSIHYFTLIANQNIPQAQFNLGLIYSEGKYITRDINKSIHYFTLAANQNFPLAQCNLGFIYYEDKYIKQDINKSIHFFSLAANNNIPEAQYNLGVIYYEGKYIKRDINKSIYYLTLAANQYYSNAQFKLGAIYYEGKYIKQDINKSIYYFLHAANQNYPEAQFNLGVIYYLGMNISKDIKKGQHYIIQSSKNGLVEGNFSHGFLLHEGRHIERNIKEAIHYYNEASSFNNQYAKNNLGIIYKNGFGDEIEANVGYAIEYFEEAIRKKNDYLSMYNLAHIYIYNETIRLEDINKPIQLLIKSSNKSKYSLLLLCLLLIKRFGFEVTKFEQEIEKFDDIKHDKKSEIFKNIYSYNLFNKLKFDFYYEKYKRIDFLYGIELNPIFSSSLKYIKTVLNFSKYPNAKNISSEFYEGFGNDLM